MCSPSSSEPTPTKPRRLGGDGQPSSPAKSNADSPSESRSLPQAPIRFGPRTSNNDEKRIAEGRQERESMALPKLVARFDSLCEDSKTILGDMARMFSLGKAETDNPKSSLIRVKIKMAVPPAKKRQSGKNRCDGRGKKAVDPRRQIKLMVAQRQPHKNKLVKGLAASRARLNPSHTIQQGFSQSTMSRIPSSRQPAQGMQFPVFTVSSTASHMIAVDPTTLLQCSTSTVQLPRTQNQRLCKN